MKNKYTRLKALLLAGTILLTSSSLAGCSKKNSKDKDSNTKEDSAIIVQDSTKYFDIGEHIISIPIDSDESSHLVPIHKVFSEVKQYEYHEGYKAVGIAVSCHAYSYGGACIIYENEYPVECHSTSIDENGNSIYKDFGRPIDFQREETTKTSNTKDFNIGEHIISIPIKDPTSEAMQYEYHEGYEVIGIATSDYAYDFGGACILYVNTQSVTCTITESSDNQELYLSFGIPLEKETIRILK